MALLLHCAIYAIGGETVLIDFLPRQVLENYRRQSVDGLAWPFLLNWMLGEASTTPGQDMTA